MIDLTVYGRPAPQGSHRAFVRNGRAIVTDDSAATKPWKACVEAAIREYLAETPEPSLPWRCPVGITLQFRMPRPKSHFRANGEVRQAASIGMTSKPDIDKLARSTLDAIVNAGVIADDSYVVDLHVTKAYANGSPLAFISIRPHSLIG